MEQRKKEMKKNKMKKKRAREIAEMDGSALSREIEKLKEKEGAMNSWDKERLRDLVTRKVAVERDTKQRKAQERLDLRGGNAAKRMRGTVAQSGREGGAAAAKRMRGAIAPSGGSAPSAYPHHFHTFSQQPRHPQLHPRFDGRHSFPTGGLLPRAPPSHYYGQPRHLTPPHPHTYPRPHGSVRPNHQGMAMGMLRPHILPPPPRSFSGVRHMMPYSTNNRPPPPPPPRPSETSAAATSTLERLPPPPPPRPAKLPPPPPKKELTVLVPTALRVRREKATSRTKLKAKKITAVTKQQDNETMPSKDEKTKVDENVAASSEETEICASTPVPPADTSKADDDDGTFASFMEEMKELGAL